MSERVRIRLYILLTLYVYRELSFMGIYKILSGKFEITKGRLDYHLKQLCQEGLLTYRKSFPFLDGSRVKYRITQKGIDEIMEIRNIIEFHISDSDSEP
jgi:DNA-binding PadR family transcriptional regulator